MYWLRNFTAAGLLVAGMMASLAIAVLITASAQAANKKPNIVVIWGDDIGQSNVSAYTHGLMG